MSGIEGAADLSDLFGVWRPWPGDSDAMRSFSAQDTTVPVWSAWLPASTSEATVHMSAAEATLAGVHEGLPRAEDRLSGVLAQLEFSRQPRVAASAARTALRQHEADLLEGVAGLQSSSDVSFGLSTPKSTWTDASEAAMNAVKQVQAGISARGVVETHVGEALIGQTYAGLLGAGRTLLRAGCAPADLELHVRTVSLSLSSRVAMVSVLAAAVRGAARLSVALALPGGPLLLLPAVLRFITSVGRDDRNSRS